MSSYDPSCSAAPNKQIIALKTDPSKSRIVQRLHVLEDVDSAREPGIVLALHLLQRLSGVQPPNPAKTHKNRQRHRKRRRTDTGGETQNGYEFG